VKQDYFYVNNIHKIFIKNLSNYINEPNLKFLEIGSHSGSSASGTLNTILTGTNCTITCVDHWVDNESEDFFDSIVEFYSPRIIKVKSDSVKWLQENQDLAFDFIYIDGDHSTQGIESDTRLSWPILKVGGVMALDDVLLNDETKEANNAFIESVKDKSIIVDNGYQVWLRKTTE
jgi:predicted O-methyltransferase YrrM